MQQFFEVSYYLLTKLQKFKGSEKIYDVCLESFTDYKADLACISSGFNRGAISWTLSSDGPEIATSGSVNVFDCKEGASGLLDCHIEIASKHCNDHVVLHCKGKKIWLLS